MIQKENQMCCMQNVCYVLRIFLEHSILVAQMVRLYGFSPWKEKEFSSIRDISISLVAYIL
jgi:hypothetical protein